MVIPESLKVGAHDVSVRWSDCLVDKDGDQLFGLTTPWMNLIEIARHYREIGLPESSIADAYFHEITHIINAMFGLDLTENQIVGLSGAWLMVIRDNDLDFREGDRDLEVQESIERQVEGLI